MKAIAAHCRYISKNGRLEIEDDRGVVEQGRDALKETERQWQYGGACIDDVGYRREAFNVLLSMPNGTDPTVVLKAAREFAKIEFVNHRYVMVLHTHQGNPHVHLSVKAVSKHGERLNRERPTCTAGAKGLQIGCASGASTPTRLGRRPAAPLATTRIFGGRGQPRREGRGCLCRSARRARRRRQAAEMPRGPGPSLQMLCRRRRIRTIADLRWTSGTS